MMVSIVETEAKEMPWTSGSWAPNNGTPRVCSTVASPLTKRALETSSPFSAPLRPAAPPTMSGTAMTPPNIARMCWTP